MDHNYSTYLGLFLIKANSPKLFPAGSMATWLYSIFTSSSPWNTDVFSVRWVAFSFFTEVPVKSVCIPTFYEIEFREGECGWEDFRVIMDLWFGSESGMVRSIDASGFGVTGLLDKGVNLFFSFNCWFVNFAFYDPISSNFDATCWLAGSSTPTSPSSYI